MQTDYKPIRTVQFDGKKKYLIEVPINVIQILALTCFRPRKLAGCISKWDNFRHMLADANFRGALLSELEKLLSEGRWGKKLSITLRFDTPIGWTHTIPMNKVKLDSVKVEKRQIGSSGKATALHIIDERFQAPKTHLITLVIETGFDIDSRDTTQLMPQVIVRSMLTGGPTGPLIGDISQKQKLYFIPPETIGGETVLFDE